MKAVGPFADADDAAPYTVRYAPYDAAFPEVFDGLGRLVRDAVGTVRLEHVGNTSVPGLGGRNALDVAMPTIAGAQPAARQALHGLGFQDSPFPRYLPLLVGRLDRPVMSPKNRSRAIGTPCGAQSVVFDEAQSSG